jgi:uncharacterized protein YeaC (DUF1315 family)
MSVQQYKDILKARRLQKWPDQVLSIVRLTRSNLEKALMIVTPWSANNAYTSRFILKSIRTLQKSALRWTIELTLYLISKFTPAKGDCLS